MTNETIWFYYATRQGKLTDYVFVISNILRGFLFKYGNPHFKFITKKGIMTYKLITILFVILSLNLTACSHQPSDLNRNRNHLKEITDNLKNSTNNYVLVAAHRGDWRNAPENSIQAIKNCIEMGVDMVEIDVRMTKDSALVLMHDNTIDRTTTGEGKVSEWTLDY